MIQELYKAFNHIQYKDSTHQYFTTDGTQLGSITQFLGKLKPKFDKSYWTVYKSYEFSGYQVKYDWRSKTSFYVATEYFETVLEAIDGTTQIIKDWQYYPVNLTDDHSHLKVSPQQVADQWQIDSLIGTTRGTFLHNYLENRESRLLDDPTLPNIPELNTHQTIWFYESLKTGIKLCDEFVKYQQANLIPIAMEYTVGDTSLKLAGRFDRLYFNLQTQEYEIWDFKTDKKINLKSKSSTKYEIFNLSDCEIEKYSLQTSMYKHLVEKHTGIKLGQSRIVHIDIKNNEWKIYDCKDYTQLIIDKSTEISWL